MIELSELVLVFSIKIDNLNFDLQFLIKKATFTVMIQQITKGIKISVKTKYTGASYRNNQLYHIFAYFISIENKSPETVQLMARYWKIFDSLNQTEILEGEGVIGQTPILVPNDNYTYSSGCFLESTMGAMKGYYTMINIQTFEEFKVYIPTFQLVTPILSN